jgi:hypothetical protein
LEFYPHVKRGNRGKKPSAATTPDEPAAPAAEEVSADAPTGT